MAHIGLTAAQLAIISRQMLNWSHDSACLCRKPFVVVKGYNTFLRNSNFMDESLRCPTCSFLIMQLYTCLKAIDIWCVSIWNLPGYRCTPSYVSFLVHMCYHTEMRRHSLGILRVYQKIVKVGEGSRWNCLQHFFWALLVFHRIQGSCLFRTFLWLMWSQWVVFPPAHLLSGPRNLQEMFRLHIVQV